MGAGIAGLVAASAIANAGHSVIVLESGGRKPDAGFDSANELDEALRLYQTAINGRVRALGGTSTAWGGRLMPLTAEDLEARPHVGLEGWPITKAELDRYLPPIESLFDVDSSPFEANYDTRFSLEKLTVESLPLRSRWAKWPTFKRRNIATILQDRLRREDSLQVWLNATAFGFGFDRTAGRVTAIKAKTVGGRQIRVEAEQFILACGTFETTRLLLMLERATEGRAFGDCQVLGRYFNDHLAVEVAQLQAPVSAAANHLFGYHIGGRTRRSLHLETTFQAQRDDGAASGFVTVRPEFTPASIQALVKRFGHSAQSGRFEGLPSTSAMVRSAVALGPALYWKIVHGKMHFGPHVNLFLDARIEQVPQFDSRLTLSDQQDQFGIPKLRLNWRKSDLDELTLRSVVKRARYCWGATTLQRSCPIQWQHAFANSEIRIVDQSRDTRHPAGSARMGLNSRTSVVNKDLRCHAAPNVSLASAAAFPSSGSANPTLTIMQLAMLAADRVIAAA